MSPAFQAFRAERFYGYGLTRRIEFPGAAMSDGKFWNCLRLRAGNDLARAPRDVYE
jgi:hypothetical protein